MLVLLFAGGFAVVGYAAAIVIGGETGAAIVTFLYERFFVWLTYIVCAVVVIGMVRVYLTGEHDFVVRRRNHAGRAADASSPPADGTAEEGHGGDGGDDD